MAETEVIASDSGAFAKIPDPSLITTTHIIYGLHALSILIGLTSALTVVGAFVFGIPSIIAVIINYVKRSDVRGTWLDSHFSWQIRTFWYSLVWVIVGAVLFVTVIGIPVAYVIWWTAGLWVLYRIIRGVLALDRKSVV